MHEIDKSSFSCMYFVFQNLLKDTFFGFFSLIMSFKGLLLFFFVVALSCAISTAEEAEYNPAAHDCSYRVIGECDKASFRPGAPNSALCNKTCMEKGFEFGGICSAKGQKGNFSCACHVDAKERDICLKSKA